MFARSELSFSAWRAAGCYFQARVNFFCLERWACCAFCLGALSFCSRLGGLVFVVRLVSCPGARLTFMTKKAPFERFICSSLTREEGWVYWIGFLYLASGYLLVTFWLPSGFGRLIRRPGSDLLSHALRRSTIGAMGFHYRVRDGIGWGTHAITTKSSK